MKKSLFTIFMLLCLFSCFAQTILEPDVLNKVQASVFEVVTNKPEEGQLVYEKELPFSKLPFSIRNDKYNPIGTAFLTDDGTFYSAAHVFNLYEDTIYKDYYIRDRNGNIYEVDQITKFSTDRDFISFTVKDFQKEEIAGLSIEENFSLNSAVFSVGNALGDGIVFRNGVLTSQTYETTNGEWKWLRFSAAASPGNSGGPLITPQGDVIGIITMKSENENLNYALPIAEVKNTEDNTGYANIPLYYGLPNIESESFPYTYNKIVELPMSLEEVQDLLINDFQDSATKIVKDLSEKYTFKGEKGIATLPGKAEIINKVFASYMPVTYYLSSKGKWSVASPDSNYIETKDQAGVELGVLMNFVMAKVEPSESSNIEEMISTPKQYMDYLLEVCGYTRTVGSESVKIKSLGEPQLTETHTDYFGRLWQVNMWNLDFADCVAISYAIPLPDSVYVIFVIAERSEAVPYKNDMAFLTDYQSITYIGTLKEWQDYLNLPEKYVAKSTDSRTFISMETTEDSAKLIAGELSFDIPKTTFDVVDSTNITVCTALYEDADKCIQGCNILRVFSNSREQDYKFAQISKIDAPLADSSKSTIEAYNQKVAEVSPYDGVPYNYENYTYLDTVIFPEGTTEETKKDLPYIFVGIYEMLGQNKNEEILDFAKKIEECFKPLVSEKQQPKATTTETTSTSEKGSRFFKNLR